MIYHVIYRRQCITYFLRNGHTTSIAPHPVRSVKLSGVGPGQYYGGGPRGKPRCCSFFAFFSPYRLPPYSPAARRALSRFALMLHPGPARSSHARHRASCTDCTLPSCIIHHHHRHHHINRTTRSCRPNDLAANAMRRGGQKEACLCTAARSPSYPSSQRTLLPAPSGGRSAYAAPKSAFVLPPTPKRRPTAIYIVYGMWHVAHGTHHDAS